MLGQNADFLVVAWSKGKLSHPCQTILEEAGFSIPASGRSLLITDSARRVRFMELKAHDAVTLVGQGLVDLALVGKDTLLEHHVSVMELMDLNIGACRLCLAGPAETWGPGEDWLEKIRGITRSRRLGIATRYPLTTEEFCVSWGIESVVIELSGSVELAPSLGISDIISDLVSTGRTLRENGLVEIKEVRPITARLIASQGALHLKARQIESFVTRLRDVISEGGPIDEDHTRPGFPI